MTMTVTDIIIPIYNAYEDLEICLDSIYKHTDLDRNRLILINDNSSDPRIKEFLDRQNRENVIVIHNAENKGFSANINIGMAQSDTNDVLLLNSDTVVTEKWLEKIWACAYRDRSIGTVTPLSNNATLCSVPKFCEENKLPEGMSVDEAGAIVEKCSLHLYPEITVAHGFCMFVKREVIDLIGNFDAATFGRGYGEENDFCNRAGQFGYKHVMCDDTFILHTGTKSFVSEEKAAYIKEHDSILRERYPVQMHANDVHVRDNPNGSVSENVGIYFDLHNGKKNILYVLQADFREGARDNVGGTQLHVRHLTEKLADNYNIFVAARDGEFLNVTFYSKDSRQNRLWRFNIGPKNDFYVFSDTSIEKIWKNIISAFNIELIHVHHLYTLTFDIIYVAAELNVPVIYTLHDYFMISPSEKLLDENNRYIGYNEEAPDTWNGFLKQVKNINDGTGYIKRWRGKCEQLLTMCASIVVPDETVKNIVSQYYPAVKNKIKVIPHGYEFENDLSEPVSGNDSVKYKIEDISREGLLYRVKGWAYSPDCIEAKKRKIEIELKTDSGNHKFLTASQKERHDVKHLSGYDLCGFETLIPAEYADGKLNIRACIEADGKRYFSGEWSQNILNTPKNNAQVRNVAFIGGINESKGGREIYDLISHGRENVNWFIFGNVGYEKLKNLKQDNFAWFGGYDSNDLPRLMADYKIDIIGILSIWPETFSYTLSEAIACNVPVIVTDVGALGHRMDNLEIGWKVPIDDAVSAVEKIIETVNSDDSKLELYRKNISEVKNRDLKQMTAEYSGLYEEYIVATSCDSVNADYSFINDAFIPGNELPSRWNDAPGAADDSAIRVAYYSMVNSLTYRIVMKIRNLRIPGKEALKRLLKKKI